jgi:GTP cyclohydrolase II
VKGLQLNQPVLPLAKIATRIKIPIQQGAFEADVVSFEGLQDSAEHIALGLGNWEHAPQTNVRIHSECLTGDVFGSAKCDCGPQLNEALKLFSQIGGIVLYLRQEGRGIGLYNKLAAYALQKEGQDTYQANRTLNFPGDMRSYSVAAQMLTALGIKTIKLRTNNPDKAKQLQKWGVNVVEIVPTGLFVTPQNEHYLRAKALQTQHTLRLKDIEHFKSKKP